MAELAAAVAPLRPKVLIVDDERDVASVLSRGLTAQGYDCEVATTAEQALEMLNQGGFQAMLTDVHMPTMQGDELLQEAQVRHPHLEVVMVTAATDVQSAVRCLQLGAFDYISKPFNLMDVAERIRKALERRQLLDERDMLAIRNHDYRLNLEQMVADQANQIRLMFEKALQVLNQALEAKDESTRNHSSRVQRLSVAIAERMLPNDKHFQNLVSVAAMFHDIGKIGVPESILLKPGPLTPEEYDELKQHTVIGASIVAPLFEDSAVPGIVRGHHEQWLGCGYPDGLAGEEIPLGARIVAVADGLDAMTSHRPYRQGMSLERAMEIIVEGAGKQWDANAVLAVKDIHEAGLLEPMLFGDAPEADVSPNFNGWREAA